MISSVQRNLATLSGTGRFDASDPKILRTSRPHCVQVRSFRTPGILSTIAALTAMDHRAVLLVDQRSCCLCRWLCPARMDRVPRMR